MIKIRISYETQEERTRIMQLLDPVMRGAKIKENWNSEKFNHIYITKESLEHSPLNVI